MKVGHTSELPFGIYIDELEKQMIIKKTLEVGQQKEQIILIFTMLHF